MFASEAWKNIIPLLSVWKKVQPSSLGLTKFHLLRTHEISLHKNNSPTYPDKDTPLTGSCYNICQYLWRTYHAQVWECPPRVVSRPSRFLTDRWCSQQESLTDISFVHLCATPLSRSTLIWSESLKVFFKAIVVSFICRINKVSHLNFPTSRNIWSVYRGRHSSTVIVKMMDSILVLKEYVIYLKQVKRLRFLIGQV